jgi:hypothetical protein
MAIANITNNILSDSGVATSSLLTTSAAASTYVPYTGATTNVDLGIYNITAHTIRATGSANNAGQINLRSDAIFSLVNGYGTIGSGTTNQFNFYQTTGAGVFRGAIFSLNSITASATRTFTLPDADGTIALTSSIPANPVGGTGSAGQVAYWSSSSVITGESTLFWDSTNDRLGIGASPSFPLDLLTSSSGTFNTIAQFFNNDFTAGNRSYLRVRQQINAGATSSSYFGTGQDGNLYIIANDSARGGDLVINAGSGNVLIGTPTDAGFKLDVNGTGRFSGALTTNGRIFTSASVNDNIIEAINGDTTNGYGLYIRAGGTATNRYVARFKNGADNDVMWIASGGNVGIGTASPSAYLDIVAPAGVSNPTVLRTYSNQHGLGFKSVISGTYTTIETNNTSYPLVFNPSGGNVLIGTTTDSGHKLQVNGNISISGNNYLDFGNGDSRIVNTGGILSFQTYTIGDFGTRMTITGPGNVGIGTATINASSGYKMLKINGATTGGEIVLSGNDVEHAYMYASSGIFVIDAFDSKPMRFRTGNQNRMEITSGGNVGIGSTGYSGIKLQITSATSDSSSFAFSIANSSVQDLFYVRSDGYMNTGSRASSPYNLTSGNAANMVVGADGTLYRSTSSLKYKTDIVNYDKGLAEVMQIRPVYYKSINEREKDLTFAGLIAEEIEELGLTEFVQYAEDGTPDALSYSNMISLLIKAIQEQQQQIDKLKNA